MTQSVFRERCVDVSPQEIALVKEAIRHRTQIKCKTVARILGLEMTNHKITNSKIGKILAILGFVKWNPKKRKGNNIWIRKWQYDLIMRME